MTVGKIVWVLSFVAMVVLIVLIIFRFLADLPIVAGLVAVIAVIVCVVALPPSVMTKRIYKAILLVALVVLTIFTTGLYVGGFEAISLLEDSWIDISRCVMVFHVKNVGLTDWTMNEIKVANLTVSLAHYPYSPNDKLGASESEYLKIYYCVDTWEQGKSDSATRINWTTPYLFKTYPEEGGLRCTIKGTLDPLTFRVGSSYKVTFNTGSFLEQEFEVKAIAPIHETLSFIGGFSYGISNDGISLSIWFNNTNNYNLYLHSFHIDNVTFDLRPVFFLRASSDTWFGVSFYAYGFSGYQLLEYSRVKPEGNLTSTMLNQMNPIAITFRTMTDNHFTLTLDKK